MIEDFAENANGNVILRQRGQRLTFNVLMGVGNNDYLIQIEKGRVAGVVPRRLAMESSVFSVRASADAWSEHWTQNPKRGYHDLLSMIAAGHLAIDGDLLPFLQNLLYFKMLFAAPRQDVVVPVSADSIGKPISSLTADGPLYEPIMGRYFNMPLGGRNYRIYVEEAGHGIPLVCLHTAGSDGRQFRHLMCDPAITDHFRVLAFDLPWHGKSTPPAGWEQETYQLTTHGYKELVQAFCGALALENPVVMGCSMGGRVVLHLAMDHPSDYRAVIALEGADKLEPYYDIDWLHRSDIHGGEISAGYVSGQVAPQSPDEYRWETLWSYMQSGPGIFKGDLYFYWHDGHFDDRSHLIDTSKCPVYLLSGEYDSSCTPERSEATHLRIKGSVLNIMEGIGHFPMSENPDLFRMHLLPVLDRIRNEK